MKLLAKALNLTWIFLFSTIVLASNPTLQHNKFPIKLEKLENFQLKIHNKLEDIRIRRRRTFEEGSYESSPIVSAKESKILTSGQSIAVISVVNANGTEVAFAGTEEGNIVLYHNNEFISLFSFPPQEPIYSLLSFQVGSGLWLVGLHNGLQSGHFLQVYECNNTSVLKESAAIQRQRINLPGSSLITLVNVKNRIHLVLVINTDLNSVLRLYVWTGTHFDKLVSSSLKGSCKSLTAWESDKILFMAISLFDENQLHILQLKENEESFFSLLQILPGSFRIVYHFEFAGSQYLVSERENKLVFFWWNGVHFRGQQDISFSDSEPVVDISILVLSRILILVVVKPSRLEYYVQDSSVTFTKSGVSEIPEFLKIKSAKLWKKDDVFRLLPVFQESREAVWFKLEIQFRRSSSNYETTKLLNCTSEIDDILQDIENQLGEVSSRLNNVWMKNNSSFIPFIEIEGNVAAERASISNLSLTNDDTPSVLSLLKLNQQLLDKVNEVNFALNGTLRRIGDQEIKGYFDFVMGLNAAEVNINSLESEVQINGVQVSSLRSVLTTKGDQTFNQKMTISSASLEIVNTDLLNYNKHSDYLLLKNRRQVVRGNMIFMNITVENMSKTHTLNKMKLNEVVTSSTPQTILDTKIFELLSSKNISTNDLINGISMGEFKDAILKKKFDKKLTFVSNVVATNMTINVFNGYDAAGLLFQSVKRSENNDIKGFKKFTLPLHIQDELSVSTVNELYLDNLMTLDSDQSISSDVYFPNVSFKEVATHFVNGIDLCSEAVKKTGFFEVNKVVKFKQSFKVVNITMKDGATIDTVDVSNLVPLVIRERNVTFYNAIELDNMHVENDVVIEDEAIALLLSNFLNDVWFKSKMQDIPYGYFKIFPAKQLHLNKWNTIPFKDIVLSNLSSDIDSAKSFEDVQVESISIKDGKTLNGIDFSSNNLYPIITDALNHFKVNNVFIEGDLDLSTINFINISDLMQTQAFQYSDGVKKFKDIFVNKLIASDLNFSTFGMISFMDYTSRVADPLKGKILNKDFKFIVGKELDFQGFLNGRTFDEMFQSVATLNSNQNISSNTVFNVLKAKELFVKNLEGMNFDNIVVRDQALSNISRKEFVGFVEANSMTVYDFINDVDLSELEMNAFYKKENNTVFEPMTFQSSLKTVKIQISSNATLDDLNFEDLIQVDQDLYLDYMNASTINTQNVDIIGKINGCDLLDIYDGVGDFETLSKKHFINLNIVGDLHIKSSLNNISEEDFSRIASALDSDYFEGNFYFSSINAKHMQVPSSVNEMDVQFILEDAVRQQTDMVQGRKKFRKNIHSNKTSANFLNVTSICGLNIPLVYRKYVSKSKPQNLYLKSLQRLEARNIAIVGFLNGIKLPADLVLIDTDETILVPVIWNDTMTLASNFSIEGLINEVELEDFLSSVVNLESLDIISSYLIFLKDTLIEGDAEIDVLNKVVMNETVTKLQEASIQGIITFQEDLTLESGLIVNGSVNNVSLELLSENVCRTMEDESILDVVNFPSLRTYTLNVDNVNNISLEYLWNHLHDVEENIFYSMDRLTSDMNHGEETISVIKDHQNSQLSLYGFFELYQVLNLGPTLRFLPLFESGIYGDAFYLPTIEMTVWVERNFSCRNFKSIVMNVHPDGTLSEKEKINARVFPFSLRILDEDVQGFSLYTDRNNRCKVNDTKPDFIKTIFLGGNESKNVIDSPSKSVVSEAKLLEMDSGVYILIIYDIEGDGERMYLYKYDLMADTWTLWQKLHTWEVSSFDIIYIDDTKQSEVCLAVTGDTNSGLFLYHWNFKAEKFYLKTSSSKSISSALKWVSTEKEVFLMLTKEKTKIRKDHDWTIEYIDPVEVLILKDDLQLHQELNLLGIHSFEEFNLAGETFVLAVSRHLQTIYVIQYKGFHGFEVIQQIHAPGVLEVTVFSSIKEELLFAVSSSTGHTRILKCIIRSSKAMEP